MGACDSLSRDDWRDHLPVIAGAAPLRRAPNARLRRETRPPGGRRAPAAPACELQALLLTRRRPGATPPRQRAATDRATLPARRRHSRGMARHGTVPAGRPGDVGPDRGDLPAMRPRDPATCDRVAALGERVAQRGAEGRGGARHPRLFGPRSHVLLASDRTWLPCRPGGEWNGPRARPARTGALAAFGPLKGRVKGGGRLWPEHCSWDLR